MCSPPPPPQASTAPGKQYRTSLVNALTLYLGTQAIDYLHSLNTTPSVTTVIKTTHFALYKQMILELDTEGLSHYRLLQRSSTMPHPSISLSSLALALPSSLPFPLPPPPLPLSPYKLTHRSLPAAECSGQPAPLPQQPHTLLQLLLVGSLL